VINSQQLKVTLNSNISELLHEEHEERREDQGAYQVELNQQHRLLRVPNQSAEDPSVKLPPDPLQSD